MAYHLAGYSAPPLVGLLLARSVDRGWNPAGTLAVLLLLVGFVVVFHGNFRTLLVIVVSSVILAILFWKTDPGVQWGAVVALAWLLLIGSIRRGTYLVDQNTETDARALQQITGISETFWIALFLLVIAFCVILGARWLLASG